MGGGGRVAVASQILAVGYVVPDELEALVEAAVVALGRVRVAEVVVADDVDDRTRHSFSTNKQTARFHAPFIVHKYLRSGANANKYVITGPVLLDLVEERRQPADTGLAVRVQKSHRVAGGDLSAAQT